MPQFEGFGCSATRYCAAMTIDSVTENQNNGVFNTNACDNYILGGQEPVNWAYVTKSGVSQAPADPLFTGTFDNPNFSAVNPDYNRDLLMSPGDRIRVHLHDTPAGYRVDMTDLKTHKSGSMTASIANGFAHVLYTPGSGPCKSAPYAFHAEYDTANPRGNTWSAHTTNVSYSDEIGHFEHCLQLDANFNCAVAGSDDPTLDDDDVGCVPGQGRVRRAHQRLLRERTTTSTGPRTRTTGPGRIPTRRSTRSCIHSRCSSRARPRRAGTTIR